LHDLLFDSKEVKVILQSPGVEILDDLPIVGFNSNVRHSRMVPFEKEPSIGSVVMQAPGPECGVSATSHSTSWNIEGLVDSELSKNQFVSDHGSRNHMLEYGILGRQAHTALAVMALESALYAVTLISSDPMIHGITQ
jgi:hypothetical protein